MAYTYGDLKEFSTMLREAQAIKQSDLTIREAMHVLHLKSTSATAYCLNKIAEAGFITVRPAGKKNYYHINAVV
jgi:hypothetical protein